MGGGLMQLVAYGAQDVYLSGNPQITFFKVVYRRHTNFSVEPIPQTWNGAADFGRTVTCNINRNGDLITNMYLVVDIPAAAASANAWGYVSRLGHALVSQTKIEIGGSKIDEQYGDWLNVWYELSHKVGQERGYAKMIGDVAELNQVSTAAKPASVLYVPLQYWFNRNNGLALPLIALQYHDVRVTVQLNSFANVTNWVGSAPAAQQMKDCYLLIDYVYLDSEERKRFAQASHEYLIEQLQFTGSESLTSVNNKYRLNFNHPSKYLIWVPHLDRYQSRNSWVAHAAQSGDWRAAADRFAKVLNLATAAVVVGASSVTVTPANCVNAAAALNVVDLVNTATAGISAALLAKFEVRNVVENVDASPATLLTLGSGASAAASIAAAINNSVVLRNDLTMEDMSSTLAQLSAGASASGLAILNAVAVSVIDAFNYGNFVDGSDNPVYNAKIQLNGHDRFQALDGAYFNYVQPYQHFSNTPADGVNVYSFALKAEDHQPTGTCNFSRIDNATLQVDLGVRNAAAPGYAANYLGSSSNSLLNIYTVNYNVLRVMSGMAGTAYSN
jgi:hypothetical protein